MIIFRSLGNVDKSQSELHEYGFQKYSEFHELDKRMERIKMERKELEKLDVEKYIGTKTEIANAEMVTTKHGEALRLTTSVIDEAVGENGLRVNKMFSFMRGDDGKAYIGIDTKLDNFCKQKKIDVSKIPEDLNQEGLVDAFVGIPVTVQLSTRNSDYLDFI